jgi:UDP-2,4-diacetamido-2,4,6-trideoxy-beta-L-altropyranose hydrolase
MNGKPLILRADASEAIGTGHVMRCLAIAQHWRALGGHVVFAVRSLPSAMQARLIEEGFECKPIACDGGTVADAAETLKHVATAGAEWLVVDLHNLSPSYQREAKAQGHRLLLIDDYPKPGHYCADVVVNTDLGQWEENLYADRAAHTRLLLGPQYALLRRDFLNTPPAHIRSGRHAPRILVTFGSSDPENMSEGVLRVLAETTERPFEARVVIGSTNPRVAELQRFAGQKGRASIELMSGVRNMTSLMRWADVAVVASGITVWESLYLGVPCLCWPRHEFDRRNLSVFDKMGALVLLPRDGELGAIVDAIFRILDDPARASALAKLSTKLVDGRGTARILTTIRDVDALHGRR